MTTQTTIDTEDFQRLLNRNLRQPIAGGVIGALVFVLLIAYLLSTIALVEQTDRVTRSAAEAQRRSIDMEAGVRGYLLTGEASFLEPYDSALARMKDDLGALRMLVADNRAQAERVDRIASLQNAWNAFASELIERRRNGGEVAEAVRLGSGKRVTDDMRAEYAAFMEAEQNLRYQRNNDANRTAIVVVASFVLFTLVATGLMAFFGRRRLLRLSGSYHAMLQEQAASGVSLEAQARLRGAQTELSGELVGELSAQELGRKVLTFFARRVGSPVGAFYLRERQGTLRRVASYGFSAEAEASPQVLGPTEGLVGQTATERRRMLIEPVDAAYLKVNSGLGAMPPAAAVLLPVSSDGVVNGVLELGFLRTPGTEVHQLLEMVANNIGSAVAAVRIREQLQDALAETRQLNEELQVQQEELRAANKGLEEQSRALRVSQSAMENQQAALEQTNSQLSERTEALDLRNAALRRAQRQLEDRARELQEASRYKTEFLANMSHELRTPLNSALILARLLRDNVQGNLSEEQVSFADSIYSSGNDLLALIDDILDIAKVEAGRLDVVAQDVRIANIAAGLEAMFRPPADDKRLGLRVEVCPDAPATLVTDRQRVEQILKNLLSNALKFTDRGELALTVRGGPEGGALFEVADTGIGIAGDQIDVVFEAFRQADGTASRRHGGTGLGLSISRDLAQLLGGTLSVSSTAGAGSSFTLALPARAPQADATEAAEAGPAPLAAGPRAVPAVPHRVCVFEGRRILLVDDDVRNIFALSSALEQRGAAIEVARNGREALQKLDQVSDIDLVLMDVMMPEMDGLEATRRLRQDPRFDQLPVIVVTAKAMKDDQAQCLAAGASDYLAKPVDLDRLFSLLRVWMPKDSTHGH